MVKSLVLFGCSLMVAVGLGTMFSSVYPTIPIDFSIAFLFTLVGLLSVLAVYWIWQTIWRKKR
jgi:hypothetical protein